jgi:hypothetical protein
MIDAVGATAFTYSGSGQLLTEDGPFASDASNLLNARNTEEFK